MPAAPEDATPPAGAAPHRPPLSLALQADGWLPPGGPVLHRPSPNHDRRPEDEDPYLLVIHNISLPPGVFEGDAVIDFFQNRLDIAAHPWFENIRDLRVSAHFLIRRDGRIVQFVPTTLRAWHAGVSAFQGRERCNDYAIGIELEGTDTTPYTGAQYAALNALAAAICSRHPIRAACGHEHIAPGRKTDPGPAFEWGRLAGAAPLAPDLF
ncbi:1,6-anhydro-N-acetylmuramyl-L-alanine amidase AmpD [Castellaniella hirudinis]|uniref:1,6-anhydro-N-acetylmuramyl-L-alanine amidase AmpD n=1 Tax=Castellaniella hirudinis TaxID=1144617 RepID=UPI0039C47ED5